MVEFHHGFWLPALVRADVLFQALHDEAVVCMLLVVLDVKGVMAVGRHDCRLTFNFSNSKLRGVV